MSADPPMDEFRHLPNGSLSRAEVGRLLDLLADAQDRAVAAEADRDTYRNAQISTERGLHEAQLNITYAAERWAEWQERAAVLGAALVELDERGFLSCIVEPPCGDCTVCRARALVYSAAPTYPDPDPYRVVEDALDALGWFETEKDDDPSTSDDLIEQATTAVVSALQHAGLLMVSAASETRA